MHIFLIKKIIKKFGLIEMDIIRQEIAQRVLAEMKKE